MGRLVDTVGLDHQGFVLDGEGLDSHVLFIEVLDVADGSGRSAGESTRQEGEC